MKTYSALNDDDDAALCSSCDGSGEGMMDGHRCGRCRGTGLANYDEDRREMLADMAYDEWKDRRNEEP